MGMARRRAGDRRLTARGFTIIELIIALLLGVVILSAAITFLITHLRTLEGSDIRENVDRNGRYIGVLLRRDIQAAGIDISSTTSFGTVAVWQGAPNDTLMLLYVPYSPQSSPIHNIDTSLVTQPPVGEGTCSPVARCLTVLKEDTATFDIGPGDLARLQVSGTRRLIIVESINVLGCCTVEVTFTNADTLLHQPAGLNNLQVQLNGTFIQKLSPLIYYVDSQDRLMRAQSLNMDGSPAGDVVAEGLDEFGLSLVFADGDTLPEANPLDSDDSNDYDDIVAVLVKVTVKADRTDPRVNNGQLLKRSYEWQMSPRNLRYEKNRISS